MTTRYVATNGSDSNAGTLASPFATLDHAITASANGDAIAMRGGRHFTSSTIAVSNFTGLSIIPYNGETVVLTSSVAITGWTLFDADKNIWQASAQGVNSLDLIVNNKRSTLSQFYLGDTSGWTAITGGGYSGTGGAGNGWANPTKMMLQIRRPTALAYSWAIALLPITSITSTQINIDATAGTYRDFNLARASGYIPSHILNSYEGLAATPVVGMHYIDVTNNLVYYRPRPDEDMSVADAFIPSVDETLIRFTNCSNIVFGITCEGTTSLRGQKTGGFVENQSGYLSAIPDGTGLPSPTLDFSAYSILGGMVEFDGCTTVDLTGSAYYHAGANALWLHNGTTGATIAGVRIYDSAAGGIHWGAYKESNLGTPSGSSTITECFIGHSGQRYYGASHIVSMFAVGLTISNVTCAYNNYAGIQVINGWNTTATVTGGNHSISNVQILEFDQDDVLFNSGSLKDVGGIYLNGGQGTTTISGLYITRNSLITSSTPVPALCAAMYFDDGAHGITATNIVVDGNGLSGGANLWFHENDNLGTPVNSISNAYVLTGLSADNSSTTVANVHSSSSPSTDTSGSPTAPAIIAAAGLSSGSAGLAVPLIPTSPKIVYAHWNLSSPSISGTTIRDVSGNANHLTAIGTPTFGTGPGVLAAISGNASRSVFDLDGLDNNEMSIWLKPNTLPTAQIVTLNGDSGSDGEGFIIAGAGFTPGSKLQFAAFGQTFDILNSTATFTQGQWMHVTLSRPNGTPVAYVNGVLDTGAPVGFRPITPETKIFALHNASNDNHDIDLADPWLTPLLAPLERQYVVGMGLNAPAAPVFVVATPGTGSVTVRCERSFNASSWKLFRSTDNTTFTQVGTTSSSPTITDSTGTAGTNYFYRMVASNAVGDSSQSESAPATSSSSSITAAGSASLPPASGSGSAALSIAATGSSSTAGETGSGSSSLSMAASGSAFVPAATGSGSALMSIGGTGSGTVPSPTGNGSATIGYTPVLTSIVLSPSSATLQVNTQQQFTASAFDQEGNPFSTTFVWSMPSGASTVDDSGNVTAASTPESAVVRATSGSVHGDASVTVTDNTDTRCLGTLIVVDSFGTVESGVVVTFQCCNLPSDATGFLYDSTPQPSTSDSDGEIQRYFPYGGITYKYYRGNSSKMATTFVTPTTPSTPFDIKSGIGTP